MVNVLVAVNPPSADVTVIVNSLSGIDDRTPKYPLELITTCVGWLEDQVYVLLSASEGMTPAQLSCNAAPNVTWSLAAE